MKIIGIKIEKIIKMEININDLCEFSNILDELIGYNKQDISEITNRLKPISKELHKIINSSEVFRG